MYIYVYIISLPSSLCCSFKLNSRQFKGGCCSEFKLEIKDVDTGEKMWISRHGTASDEDEMIWNNFDCGETVRLTFTA